MPSDRPPRATRPPSRQVYIDDETWERIQQLAFNWKPKRRSASDLVREMIEQGLPRIEDEARNGRSE